MNLDFSSLYPTAQKISSISPYFYGRKFGRTHNIYNLTSAFNISCLIPYNTKNSVIVYDKTANSLIFISTLHPKGIK